MVTHEEGKGVVLQRLIPVLLYEGGELPGQTPFKVLSKLFARKLLAHGIEHLWTELAVARELADFVFYVRVHSEIGIMAGRNVGEVRVRGHHLVYQGLQLNKAQNQNVFAAVFCQFGTQVI